MKKENVIKIVITVIIIIVVVIIGVLANIKCSEKNPSIDGNAYMVGFRSIPIEDREKLITNYQELIQYLDKYYNGNLLNSYNEEFFNNKQLAIIYQEIGTGMASVEYKKCEIKDEVAYIEYKEIIPNGEVTMDMSGYFVIVELPKEVTSIVTKIIDEYK